MIKSQPFGWALGCRCIFFLPCLFLFLAFSRNKIVQLCHFFPWCVTTSAHTQRGRRRERHRERHRERERNTNTQICNRERERERENEWERASNTETLASNTQRDTSKHTHTRHTHTYSVFGREDGWLAEFILRFLILTFLFKKVHSEFWWINGRYKER